jgi:hypothetical protein
MFSGRRPDGYVTFDSEDAAAAAMEVGSSSSCRMLFFFGFLNFQKENCIFLKKAVDCRTGETSDAAP